jgi:FAD:protein FMN transferase
MSSPCASMHRLHSHFLRGSGLACLCLLAACTRSTPALSSEFLALGTVVTVTVANPTADSQAAIDAARKHLERIGQEWYPWSADGELVRVNRALAAGQSVALSAPLAEVLRRARVVFAASNGAFDPTVGRLVQLWGFDRAERPGDLPWPDAAQLDAWAKNRPTFDMLRLQDGRLSTNRQDLLLDLGAIGKGYAVDAAIAELRRRGVAQALVDAGGNLRAIGGTAARPWRVAIRHPRNGGILARLALNGDESVATSGDYERFAVQADAAASETRAHHLLDPRTGRPATHTQAVTVLADDATWADAASTAVFVAGPQAWQAVARRLHIKYVLRVDASGSVAVSRALYTRLRSAGSDALQLGWTMVDL